MLGTLDLAPDAALRARFATSPAWEAAAALRLLAAGTHHLHGRWLAGASEQLRRAGVPLTTLGLLVPPTGHMADLLTPAPRRRRTTVAEELTRIGATDPTTVRDDLAHLTRSARDPARRRALADAAADPEAVLVAAVRELEAFWELCLAPVWSHLESLADADIAFRGRRTAEAGVTQALSELHPRLEVDGDRVRVRTTCLDEPLATGGTELLLVPTSFTWPQPLVLNHPAQPLTIGYAPRGVGALWTTSQPPDGLGDLTGATRAHALRLLDIPMTTAQLAGQLALSAPTVNEHLQILTRAGAVERRRDGRRVYYARTALGDGLVRGGV